MKKVSSTLNIKYGIIAIHVSMFMLIAQNSFSQSRQLPAAAQINQTVSQAENSIAFIENKGQWPAHVLYRADVPGGQALATPDGMLLGRFNPQSLEALEEYHMKMEQAQKKQYSISDLGPEPQISGHGWKLKFTGGNIAVPQSIERNNESRDYFNYLIGDIATHAANVHSYTEITYKNVYENIDVKYYTSPDGSLENDIIIKPKADASLVKLEIEGIRNVKLTGNGELILPTTVGEIVIPHPVSYLKETGEPVAVEFTVTGTNTIGFSIPDYDRSQTLVIDPIVLRWATFVSNNSNQTGHCHGIDVDASGNIYVTGQYTSTGLITSGAFQTTNAGGTDIFIGKYTEPALPGGTGTRLWQTYLGGTGSDNPYAITVGLDGYPYITGPTSSSLNKTYGTGFTAGGWTQRTGVGTQAFIAKITPTGTGALVREWGSASSNFNIQTYDLKVLPTGGSTFDLVAVGFLSQTTSGANGDVPAGQLPNATATTGTGDANGVAFRITSDFNTVVWSKQYSSSSNVADDFKICEIDNAGGMYIGGSTAGTAGISFTNPSTQTTRVGTTDGWLLKLNSANGTCLWSRYFNASSSATNEILCMQLNVAKTQMVIGGLTTGMNASNLISAYDNTYGGSGDFFIASVPVSGASTTWGTYFGGNAIENNMMGLNLDQNDDVYVLGYSNSKNLTAVGNPVQSATYDAASYDAHFLKLSANGQTLLYLTYLGGTLDELDPIGERGIKFSNCRIYLGISSASNNFPFSAGTLTPSRVSATGGSHYEPIIVSMANPPDLTANSITSGGTQNVACGQSPVQITASAPSYSIPAIIRNNVTQTNGTSGAYPSGLPTISSYQWQQSTNGGTTWTNIPGAAGQNYTPPATPGTVLYRRIINGDACNRDTSAIATITVPTLSPPTVSNNGPICAGQTLQLSSTATNGVTYSWSGPNNFTSTLQNPSIPNSTSAAAGTYTLVITLSTCTASASTTVTIRPGPTANAGTPRAICPNTSTQIGGNPTGSNGTAPYTYIWSPTGGTVSNPVVTPASTTTYFLTVTDATNCSATSSVTVSTTLSLSLSVTSTTTTCGLNNGTATVTPITGTGPFTYTWSPSGNTPTITNLPSGLYTVVTTDSIGCSATGSTTVGASVAVTLSASSTTTTCGLNNGSATVTTLTGVGPFTYTWNPSGSTATILNLASGAYSVVVTGAGGCSASATTSVGASVAVTLSASSTTTTCGLNNGSATATPLTGVGPFTYIWSPSGNTSTISNLASGPYSVIATGDGGCSASASTNVGSSVAVVISPSSRTTTCGLNNGSATAIISSGVGPFTYIWNTGGTTAAIFSLSPGTYQVTATGAGGCSASASATVGSSIAVTLSASSVNTSCASNNGSATVSVLTGVGPFGYRWNTGSLTQTISNLAPGTYKVTVTGATSCSATATTIVSPSVALTLSASSVNTSCGLNNGSASVSILTGAGPYTYAWSNGRTTASIFSLSPGTYSVTVIGASGCSATASSSISSSLALSITAYAVDASCGVNTGSAGVNINSGTGPFTFTWNNGGNTQVISNIGTGIYRVTVTGLGGCIAKADVTVTVADTIPPVALCKDITVALLGNSVVIVAEDVDNGSTDNCGIISRVVTPDAFDCSDLGPNSVTLTVLDGGGNSSSCSATVTVIDTIPPSAICKNITVDLAFSPLIITAADVDDNSFDNCTIISREVTPSSFDCSNLGDNTVTLTVTDQSGNSSFCTATVTVTAPPNDVTATGGRLTCAVTSIELNASSPAPAASYNWSGPNGFSSIEQNPSVSDPGIYSVTVTNANNGCSSSTDALVTQDIDAPGATADGGRLTCAVTSIQITSSSPTGGVTYEWSGPNGFSSSEQNADVTEPGTYTVTITNTDNGCTSSADALVTQDIDAPGATADGGRLTCVVTSIQLTSSSPTGGVAYEWSGPNGFNSTEQNPSVSDPGTYTVTITNTDNGCTSSADANVTQDITPPGADAAGGRLTCAVTSIQLTSSSLTSGVTYAWSGPNGFNSTGQNPSVSEPGTYTLTITNTDNGCTSSADASVTQDITPPGADATGGRLTCALTSIQLTSSSLTGGVTYSWSGPGGFTSSQQNPSISNPGTYSVTITNTDNGCTSSADANVTQDITAPGANADGGRLTCTITSIQITSGSPTGGVTFSWSGPGGFASSEQNPTVSNPGTYTVIVTNTDNGCTSSEQAIVTQDIAAPGASATGGRLTCVVTSIQLTASSPTGVVTYSWSGPGGFTSSDQNPTVGTLGTYNVTVTNTDNGCTSTAQAIVTQDIAKPDASATGGVLTCAATSIQISASSATAGVSYSWSGPGGFTSSLQEPEVNTPGIYTVTVTNTDNGCTSSAQAEVTQDITPPNVSATGGVVTCFVPCVQLFGNSTTPGVTYKWFGPNLYTSSLQNPTVCDSGRYTLLVTNPINGCTNSTSVQVDEVVPTLGVPCGGDGPIASGFELDGNAFAVLPNRPDDWDLIYNGAGTSPTFTTGVISDLPSTNDNVFAVGAKDLDDPSVWHHTLASCPDKDDILHAGAVQYGSQLYFFGDRYAVSGNAQIGFWFFKNDVRPALFGNFTNNHTVGDLLILSNFTGGGTVSTILVYEWVGGGGTDGPLNLISVPASSIFAIVNTGFVPSPWPYIPKQGQPNIFPPGSLYEGGIDLACLPDVNLCFTSFLMETRSSSSLTASLKDFVAGAFLANGPQHAKTDEEQVENEITDNPGLELRAYPNPASDATTFEFSLPENGEARLEIFNSAGARVAALFESEAEAHRTYKVNFDTRLLANGVYIYRFSTADKTYSRRLAVIR